MALVKLDGGYGSGQTLQYYFILFYLMRHEVCRKMAEFIECQWGNSHLNLP